MAVFPFGAPVVVVDANVAGGIPVTVSPVGGTPMTVGASGLGRAVTIVPAGGLPVVLLNDDGSEYED